MTLEQAMSGSPCVSVSPDGQLFAASEDLSISLRRLALPDIIVQQFQGHTKAVRHVVFNPQGTMLASGGDDKSVRIWNVEDGSCRKTVFGHSAAVLALAFSPDGRVLASGSFDKTVRIWDAMSGACLAILKAHGNFVSGVSFHPNGHLLASCSGDMTIRLWNWKNKECVAVLDDHTDYVSSVAYSKDGKYLASGSGDSTIRLWDTAAQTCQVIRSHQQAITCVRFSTDSKWLVSASKDRSVKVWKLDSDGKVQGKGAQLDRILSNCYPLDLSDSNYKDAIMDPDFAALAKQHSGMCWFAQIDHCSSRRTSLNSILQTQ